MKIYHLFVVPNNMETKNISPTKVA